MRHNDFPFRSTADSIAAVAAEDARLVNFIRWSKMSIVVLVAGLGGAASLVEISGAVVSSGRVTVEANSKSVQHLEGGIVRQIAVREGQLVSKGALLVALDGARIEEHIGGLKSQVKAKQEQLTLMKSELADLEALERKRLVPRSQMTKARREFAEMAGEHGRLMTELARFDGDRQRLHVLAPISGRVLGLQTHTVGGVVAPGQEIMRIVPSGARLVIEARVQPSDVDQVRAGQPVTIRLSAFNQRTTPELRGTVGNVSADLVADERQENHYYRALILLGDREPQRLGNKSLLPGMPADVFIQTDNRSILSYLVKPITDQLQRALREE